MNNPVPYEVIAAPYSVYWAEVGTAFPDVADAPGIGWTLLGTSGNLNYDDGAGVTVQHEQNITPWRSLGDAGSRKVFRTTEDLRIRLKLVDMTLENYRHGLNRNAVTHTTGSAGVSAPQSKIGLSRGFGVDTVALLIRGDVSPYGDDAVVNWHSQFEIPRAAQTGNPTAVFKKGEPVGLDLEWMALVDPNAANEFERFGRLVAQDGPDS